MARLYYKVQKNLIISEEAESDALLLNMSQHGPTVSLIGRNELVVYLR